MSKSSQEPALGTIGRYYLTEKLAVGAMHTVYKGLHPTTGKPVAVKVAAAALAREPEMVKRFEQEYRATSNIIHPNIVRGLDFGWDGARPYIVMEYVDGESLADRIDRLGRLEEAEALGYLTQVARGLQEAHKHGIIHRDIKPDNILLTSDGQAKLADLGLSKDLEGGLELTRPGRGLGTPNFMAPEQFHDAKHAGARCDVYSLGATLYMAVTGELPFAGLGLLSLLSKKRADDLPPPRQRVPSLSERLDWAVRRAMLSDPARRFGSCAEFIAALTGDGDMGAAGGAPSQPAGGARVPGKERRAHVRYECALPISCTINVSVHAEETEWQTQWDAQVVELSVGGIGLLLPRRFERGTLLTVRLANHDGSVTQTRQVHVVRVTRAKSAKGNRWYAGGAFTEKLSREEVRKLL